MFFTTVFYFNPRSRKGSDTGEYFYASPHLIFQSTLPQGERQLTNIHAFFRKYFNPRSRKGSDNSARSTQYMIRISIHAPARGATLTISTLNWETIFQSTLPQGERHLPFYGMFDLDSISIHAPARGATTGRKTVFRMH